MKIIIQSTCLFLLFILLQNGHAQSPDSVQSNEYNKFRFGGYGEILYQHMDYGPDRYSNPSGAPSDNISQISLPRIVFSFDYRLRQDIIFSTEIEFEYGGTGSAMELEYEESGEYEIEIEKAGEVVLEQLHFTKTFHDFLKIRLGHMILPVGQTNARHESITYFGTVRPESETSIIPLTWHETGISVFGKLKDWKYELFLVNGLDANGFSSANWIRKGKQGLFENTKMTNPAFAFRFENTTVRNLRASLSGYLGNSTRNTSKPENMDHLKGTVRILSGDMEFRTNKLAARGNIIYGNLTDSYQISSVNKTISKNIQYPRTPVAKNALSYGGEIGYTLKIPSSESSVIPFVRYEYYNSMENTENDMLADDRYQRDILTIGMNYFLIPSLVLKGDFSHRRIGAGNYNSENTIGLALCYTSWFFSK